MTAHQAKFRLQFLFGSVIMRLTVKLVMLLMVTVLSNIIRFTTEKLQRLTLVFHHLVFRFVIKIGVFITNAIFIFRVTHNYT